VDDGALDDGAQAGQEIHCGGAAAALTRLCPVGTIVSTVLAGLAEEASTAITQPTTEIGISSAGSRQRPAAARRDQSGCMAGVGEAARRGNRHGDSTAGRPVPPHSRTSQPDLTAGPQRTVTVNSSGASPRVAKKLNPSWTSATVTR